MTKLCKLLSRLDFPELQMIQGRTSIAELFPVGRRCGIYIIEFQNGELYVGQALDITRRYVQHCKTYLDITGISFKQFTQAHLNKEERAVIWELERQGFLLRNVVFTSLPKGDSDFDSLMPMENQKQWLDSITYQEMQGARVQNDILRGKYRQKFQRFLKQPHANTIIDLLKTYVHRCVPIPVQSELSFWSCSCLPATSSGMNVFSRININWQEVLTVFTDDGLPVFSFHLALSPLECADGTPEAFLMKYPSLIYSDHFYEPGDHDQIHIEVEGIDATLNFLQDVDVLKAIRLFNLRLMRKGPCTYNRYHCLDLADRLVS